MVILLNPSDSCSLDPGVNLTVRNLVDLLVLAIIVVVEGGQVVRCELVFIAFELFSRPLMQDLFYFMEALDLFQLLGLRDD